MINKLKRLLCPRDVLKIDYARVTSRTLESERSFIDIHVHHVLHVDNSVLKTSSFAVYKSNES
jgi:hypothetical protein